MRNLSRLFGWRSTATRKYRVNSGMALVAGCSRGLNHSRFFRTGLERLEPRYLLTSFTEIGVNLGAGHAAAWGDFNNDGWTDLYANYNDGTKDISSVVMRNDGGSFSMQQQLLSDGNPAGQGIWGDFNNDGYLDIFAFANHRLFRNDNGTGFTDVSSMIPSLPMISTQAATWADFNGDSFLDLYVGGYETPNYEPDAMLINNQGQGFTIAWQSRAKPGRGITAADFDEDGDVDVYVSNYRLEPNALWQNDGQGDFTDVAGARDATAGYGHTIGSAIGDLDNDGHLDIFAGNFSHAGQPPAKFLRNTGPSGGYNFQLMNELSGDDWQESYASPALGDVDNDGDLDLYVTTVYGGDDGRLYRNDGNWQFSNITSAAGDLSNPDNSYQNAWADFDNDGDLDLVTASRIYRNDSTGNNWLKLKLVGDGNFVNTTSIGAQVRATYDGVMATRQVEGGTGHGNQNDLTLHFGLGSYSGSVALEVTWPDGTVRTLSVDSNQTHTILRNEAPSVPTNLLATDLHTHGGMISWDPSIDGEGDQVSYEVQYRKDDLSAPWSSSLPHTVPLESLVVPVRTFASTGPQRGYWGIENIIIDQPSTFDIVNGTSGNPDNDADPFNDTGLGLIGYTGGVHTSRVSVPSNSAGISSSPLLFNFRQPSETYYTGHVERKPNSMWLGDPGWVTNQWIEIELDDVTELEQMWIWNWNDHPEVGRRVDSFEIQVSTVTTAPDQLGSVTWDTTFTNSYLVTTGGAVADRPVDFVQTFPAGTFARYIRINDMDHVGPASGGNNYIGLGPVFIFEASETPAVILADLEPDTTYRAKVRATDGEQTSDWLKITSLFTTIPTVPTVDIGEVGQITDLTHEVQIVRLDRNYQNPVVFAQSPTNFGGAPIVVRVTDVQADRFTIYLAEPSNKDVTHTAETVTYVVLEAGCHQLADGTRLEVGTATTSANVGKLVSNQWETVSFATDFDDTPVLLSQIQTDTGLPYLQTRQNNVTPIGAELALEQEENVSTPHNSETIGYLAIEEGIGSSNGNLLEAYNTDLVVTDQWYTNLFTGTYTAAPGLLSSLTSYSGKDNSHVRYANLGTTSVQFRVGEDTTRDTETAHGAESIAYLAIGGTGILTAVTPQVEIGESGVLTDLTHIEQTVVLQNEYANPIVFAQSATANGTSPAVVRIKDVQSDRFTVYLTEPSNENNIHGVAETISYLVLEAGRHELTDGRQLEVDSVSTDATVGQLVTNQWESVNFASGFAASPVVFSQVQTATGQVYLQTRQNSITSTGFDLALEQEELANTQHVSETIGYLAIDQGRGAWNGLLMEAYNTAALVTDQWYGQALDFSYSSPPRLLSSLTSYNSEDNAHVRYANLNGNGVQFKIDEDTTLDTETQHGAESVAYLVIGGSGRLTAIAATAPPQVLSVERDGGQDTYDSLQTLAFTFDQDVQIDAGDLNLYHSASGGVPLDLQGVTFSYDRLTRIATWDYTAVSVVQPGFHTATLAAPGITNSSDMPLDGNANGQGGDDYQHVLLVSQRGDTDLDGDIDIVDFNTVAMHFDPTGQNSPHEWQQGNFDDDLDVDISDFAHIVRNFAPLGYSSLESPLTTVGAGVSAAAGQFELSVGAAPRDTLNAVEFGQITQLLPVQAKTPVDMDERSQPLILDIAFYPRRRHPASRAADLAFAEFAAVDRT